MHGNGPFPVTTHAFRPIPALIPASLLLGWFAPVAFLPERWALFWVIGFMVAMWVGGAVWRVR